MGKCKRWAMMLCLAVTAVAAAPMARDAHAAEPNKTIKIGWTAWSDAEAVTRLARKVLEDRMGYKVDMVMTDIGVLYQGLAKGDIDAMLNSWQPTTHKAYIEKLGDQVVDVGPLYTGARLGWVVPTYVPESEVRTIEDLKKPEIAAKFNNMIQGIDPGAGLMQVSEKTIKEYGLTNYNLVSASDAAMVAALGRSIKRKNWIVATAWSPHAMFSKMQLRYLEDPKGTLGGLEHVDALVRRGFNQDHPDVFEFLSRMKLPIGDVEQMMAEAEGSSFDKAVDDYISKNPARINDWVSGKP